VLPGCSPSPPAAWFVGGGSGDRCQRGRFLSSASTCSVPRRHRSSGRATGCAGPISGCPPIGPAQRPRCARLGGERPTSASRSLAMAGTAAPAQPSPAWRCSTACHPARRSASSAPATTGMPWRHPGNAASSAVSRHDDHNLRASAAASLRRRAGRRQPAQEGPTAASLRRRARRSQPAQEPAAASPLRRARRSQPAQEPAAASPLRRAHRSQPAQEGRPPPARSGEPAAASPLRRAGRRRPARSRTSPGGPRQRRR
jgi:hypothetical protein